MNKLSLHCQAMPGWTGSWLSQSGARWIKLIDPPEQRPQDFPAGVNIVGRTYLPDGESTEMVRKGKQGALEWFTTWLPFYKSRPYIQVWESTNEPVPPWDIHLMQRLRYFTAELSTLMAGEGLKLVGFNLSVGWPYLLTFDDPAPRARLLGPAVQVLHDNGHYIGLHEYSAPTMQTAQGAYCLRYRNTVREWREAGYQVPRIFIGECGIDGGVVGRPKTGWKTFATEAEYADQLRWYDAEITKDDDVEAAFVFTAGPNQDWMDFEATESLAIALTQPTHQKQNSLKARRRT